MSYAHRNRIANLYLGGAPDDVPAGCKPVTVAGDAPAPAPAPQGAQGKAKGKAKRKAARRGA